MKKINSLFGFLMVGLLLFSTLVLANVDHESEIEEGRQLIESKVSCDDLSEEQLEAIGEYYMEQMHPGEEHEVMDEMMGGEGSESLEEMHINMARSFYCGEHDMMSSGMMNMMMGRGSTGMMGFGRMMKMIKGDKAYDYKKSGGMMKMMGNIGLFGWWGMGFGFIFMILFWGLIIWLIVWIVTRYTKPGQAGKTESAIEILKKRFAKGEITKKQYEDMKKEISK